jgi:hypothetical protein
VAVWLALTLALWLGRSRALSAGVALQPRWLALLRYFSLVVTQSSVQMCLFFALPFYFRAADVSPGHVDPGHGAFLVVLGLFCGISLWDPWSARWLARPLLGPLLPAVATFVGLNVVLPGFGVATHRSLWWASGVASGATALLWVFGAPAARRAQLRAAALGGSVLVPLALWLGAARVVPPAPLRLVRAEFGTRQSGKWIADPVENLAQAPERLICASAVAAPLGLRDQLFHVWRKNGRELARFRLDFVGGRSEGYRTRSWIGPFGDRAEGRYSCSVVTESGQQLGSRSMRIGATSP